VPDFTRLYQPSLSVRQSWLSNRGTGAEPNRATVGGEDARGSTADQPPSGGPDEILVEHGGSRRRTTWTDAADRAQRWVTQSRQPGRPNG
jgi:hypothetical protein